MEEEVKVTSEQAARMNILIMNELKFRYALDEAIAAKNQAIGEMSGFKKGYDSAISERDRAMKASQEKVEEADKKV